jgi:hypothetical protein
MRQAVELASSKKKPYQSPKLLVYGNLAQMTHGKAGTGKKDGGGRKNIRTG